MDPCFETATRLARAIRNGRLSALDATDSHLERIARLNGPLNALVVVDREGARKAARTADRAESAAYNMSDKAKALAQERARRLYALATRLEDARIDHPK